MSSTSPVNSMDVAIEMVGKQESRTAAARESTESASGNASSGPGISALESAMAAHAAMKARVSSVAGRLSGEGDEIWSGGSLRAQPSVDLYYATMAQLEKKKSRPTMQELFSANPTASFAGKSPRARQASAGLTGAKVVETVSLVQRES